MVDDPGDERLDESEEEEGGPVKSFLDHLEDLRWVLMKSGVALLVSMLICLIAGNHVVEESIKGVSEDVEKGDNLSVAMSKKSIFPPMLLRMVSAGEATGKIDNMLEKMADFWDEEIEAMLDALTSLIEPLLIVFLGLIVGGIVIAMFLPIFKLNEVVSQNQSGH